MTRMMIRSLVMTILLVLGQAAHGEPLKIRMSYIQPVTNWATMLFQTPGLAKHLNQTYTFEAMRFQGTPLLVQALAADEIEIGNFGFTALPIAVVNAGLGDVRIIADEIQDGVPGFFTDQYVVRKDSPIQTVDDLKGHVLATNVVGSGTDIPLRAMLLRHDLKDKVNVTIVEAPTAATLPMLLEHKVDLRAVTMPDYSDPKLRAVTRTLFTQSDAMGITQFGMWVARASVIAKNRAALVDFLEDALRQERWYFDPANHQAAMDIAAKITKAPAAQFDQWLFKKNGADGDYYHDPNGRPNIAALQSNIDQLQKLGFVNQSIDVKKYVDLSLIDEAAARLR